MVLAKHDAAAVQQSWRVRMTTSKALYERMRAEMDFTPITETAVREVGVPGREKADELLDASFSGSR